MSAHGTPLQPHSAPVARGALARLQAGFARRWRLGMHSSFMRYGLRRDLGAPLQYPTAKIPITVRPLAGADLPRLLALDGAEADAEERHEAAWRQAFVDKGAKGGFVAVDVRTDTPCYVQWLMGAADNQLIQRLGTFPLLQEDEALLENAYTPVSYRKLGIMAAAMALIADRAADIGAKYVLTFVGEPNIGSLKGCQKAGFHPHMLHYHTELGFGLVTRDRFQTLPDSDPRRTLVF